MIGDTLAFPHATALAAAIPIELARRGLDADLCFCGVLPGAQAAYDCEQMAWVRVTGLYPSALFPIPDQQYNRGMPLSIVRQYEVGLIRPIPVPSNGEAPSADEYAVSAENQLADMKALLAVICAYFQGISAPFLIGTYTPFGPEGGVVGGAWVVSAGSPGED